MSTKMVLPSDLIELLKVASRVVVLTGAGVSAESGLRTFRDEQTGFWAQYRPEDLATPEAFERNPKLVWDWYAERREKVKIVEPNPGHRALVEMSLHFPYFLLITQNVDGLHQRAGNSNVIELHGSLQKVKCSVCAAPAVEWDQLSEGVPVCALCGGLLRPDVVWFGESLPDGALEAAIAAASACDVFFSVGTSGLVQPAASLALMARRKNSIVVEVNPEPTPLSGYADFLLLGKSGEILPALVQAVWP
jgi:NAD-dependent deacetylase